MPKTGPHPSNPAAALPRPASTTAVRVPTWWRWPAALVLAWLTFPVQTIAPAAGVDASWQAGLQLAMQQGLHFGSDVVFTYGPLGFLVATPLFVAWTGLVALAFGLLLQVLLCRTLLHVMRDLPVAAAVVMTYVVALVAPPGTQPELGLLIILAFTLSTLVDTEEHAPRWLPVAGGAAAAVLLLIKPNVGLLALGLTAIAVGVSNPGRVRKLVELGGTFVVVAAAAWLATGNTVGDVVPWLRASAQFVSGYTAGMAYDDPSRHHEIVRAGLLLVVMATLLWRVAAGAPRARKVALALVWAIGTFAMLKEGFVRHDGHSAVFFFAVAMAAAALARGEITRIAAAGIAVVASIWSLASFGVPASALFQYTDRLDGTASEVRLLADGSARAEMQADAREPILRNLRMPPNVLHDLRSHTVDVQPTETTGVWTLGLGHWRPEPVFQSYAVLTPTLDHLNADFLVSQRAPERVLRLYPLTSIDERNPIYDAPYAFLTLMCNYRETFANGAFEVLKRATNRCGTPRRLAGGGAIQMDEPVRVPHGRPGELVYAQLEIPRPLSGRVREMLWKPAAIPAIVLDGTRYRLVAATASGPLLMRMPSSAHIAASTLRDPQVQAFRLTGLPEPVRVAFYAVRVGKTG